MKAGIIGASGYTGAELMRLLYGHAEVEVVYVTAHSYAGEEVTGLYPHLHGYNGMSYQEFNLKEALSQADFHFIALPHGESMQVVPPLLDGGAKVVDLSADYRLSDPVVYRHWYGIEHNSAHLLEEAVYGLPEIFADEISQADLVAVPGCYPTAVILALAPLADAGYEGLKEVIVDAKSGVSGAGRALSLATHYPQAEGSVKPYNVEGHRHIPEMEEVLKTLYGGYAGIIFTPHLVPMSRGILATCYIKMGKKASAVNIASLYREYYKERPFIVLEDEGGFPETKAVSGSNFCRIGWHLDATKGVLVVVSAIDNLVKGASGQALQCMNIMMGWNEDLGLESLGIFP
jgi:N-acetyl-gamma-glutamyl-phosphate reductase